MLHRLTGCTRYTELAQTGMGLSYGPYTILSPAPLRLSFVLDVVLELLQDVFEFLVEFV